MRKLYFENQFGERREIGRASTREEVYKIIDAFLKDHNYKSYYVRTWNENDGTHYDVGSHSEFFIWEYK